MRTAITMLILLAVLALAAGATYACVGARPLAMGGAFIALADDANATYWNPAGLAQMPVGQVLGAWTHTADNRDQVNYQEFASLAGSFATSKWANKIAIGASYIDDDTSLMLGLSRVQDQQRWYWGSVAVDAGKIGMFGVNVRKVHDSIDGHSTDSDWAVDASYLYKVSPKLSVGALVQDVNEPKIHIDSTFISHVQNWRAGLAYRPMSDTVITVDGYDLADNAGQKSARVGMEKVLKNFIVRAGYYGLGSDFQRGATFGLGISKELYDIDAAVLMGDFDNTVMVSADFKMM